MKTDKSQKILCAILLAVLASSCSPPGVIPPSTKTAIASRLIENTIVEYRQEIPKLMQANNIPGLAIAVVDDQGILWAEGFGFSDADGRLPITPDTIFGIQSMSKTFTASGVLMAVQAGMLDLDEPITTYLPDFTVKSIFEEQPERKITLRHLLSHTAGFTHEAPVGNNWDADATSFEEHIRSISRTWLRFPVGTGYAYSNIGMDLAGYILQRVSGQSFANYERDHLFRPLGMFNSSFDQAVILRHTNRAIGHVSGRPAITTAIAMVPAGGMYTSVMDMARFMQFLLNHAAFDGQVMLKPELFDEMLTVQFPLRGHGTGCGLGVFRTVWYKGRNADLFYHGGNGWGFDSDLWWLPELKLGVVVLANNSDQSIQGALSIPIITDLTHQAGPFHDRLVSLSNKSPVNQVDVGWQPPASLAAAITTRALPPKPDGWQSYIGDYQTVYLDALVNPLSTPSRIYEQSGGLYLDWTDTNSSDTAQYRLYETAPGLFFTNTGEALDFRSTSPTFRNIKLKQVGSGPSPLAWGVLIACGLVMLSVLLALPVRPILRRFRRGAAGDSPAPRGVAVAITKGLIITVSLCGLASIALLAAIPRLIYSGFLGWLNLPTDWKLLVHAPLGLAVCTAAMVGLSIPAWRQAWWMRGQRWHYTVLVLAALIETALLSSWRLIGIGL